jgi:hypothetical protein
MSYPGPIYWYHFQIIFHIGGEKEEKTDAKPVYGKM